MIQLRCPIDNKLLGEAEGTEYKVLLHCKRCKKIWFFHGKDSKIIAKKESIRIRTPKSVSE